MQNFVERHRYLTLILPWESYCGTTDRKSDAGLTAYCALQGTGVKHSQLQANNYQDLLRRKSNNYKSLPKIKL